MINFNARMYDLNLGMMLQADIIVPDGPVVDSLNRYAYVYNNPLSYTDPTGHSPVLSYGFDPHKDRRDEANQKWHEFMHDMGYGNLTQSGFSRKSSNIGQSQRSDTPAGVSNGSMGNGDVSNQQNSNDNQNYNQDTDEWGPDPSIGNDNVNKRLLRKNKIKVTEKDNIVSISGKIRVWKGDKVSDNDFSRVKSAIEDEWNGTYADEYASESKIYEVNFEIVESGRFRADIRIHHMDRVIGPKGTTTARAERGGRNMWISPGVSNSTAGHEFGHNLGMAHRLNPTFSVMSYNRFRYTGFKDVETIANFYRKQ